MNHPGHISSSAVIWSRVRILIGVIAWLLLVACSTSSATSLPTEYQIKSAFLYNFARYVQWPAADPQAAGRSFDICILGSDPFGPYLDSIMVDKTMNGAKMEVKRISRAQDASGCQILFISSSEENHLLQDLAALDRKSVLTVGEMAHFAKRGGMIQFVVKQSRVRFEINVGAAHRAGLAISSQLLKLATIVKENRSRGD